MRKEKGELFGFSSSWVKLLLKLDHRRAERASFGINWLWQIFLRLEVIWTCVSTLLLLRFLRFLLKCRVRDLIITEKDVNTTQFRPSKRTKTIVPWWNPQSWDGGANKSICWLREIVEAAAKHPENDHSLRPTGHRPAEWNDRTDSYLMSVEG